MRGNWGDTGTGQWNRVLGKGIEMEIGMKGLMDGWMDAWDGELG